MADRHVDPAEIECFLPDEQATRTLGADLARVAKRGWVVLLDGPLGAGKTTFVRGFADAAGAADVASPSFVVARFYPGTSFHMWHLDLYRIEDEAEIEDLDLDQYLPDDGVALVEWANRSRRQWPVDRVEVDITIDGSARRAVVRGRGRCAEEIRMLPASVRAT